MLTVNDSIKQAYNQYTTQRKSYIQVGNNSFFIQNLDVSADAYYEGNVIGNAIAKIAKFDIETVNVNGIDEFELFDGIWTGNQYEYISLGTFKLFNEEGTDDFFSSITAYDKLINFNKEYDPSLTIYPTTIYGLLQNICSQAGVELENSSIPNGNQPLPSNLFVENETLKMILNAICQISGNFGIISKDKLKLLLKGTKTVKLSKNQLSNPEYKRTTWKINQIVLGMKDVEGEYVLRQDVQDIEQNGVHKLVINDNPFVYRQDLREAYIDNLFNQVKGFGYIAFETTWEGLSYVELGDLLNVDGKESIVLRYNLKSPHGLNSTLSAPSIIDSVIDYVDNSNSIANRQRKTELWVNKELGEIKSEVIDVETTVENITTTTQTSTGGNSLYITDALESNALEYHVEGKSEQETRSGKNKFNTNLVENSTLNGVTLTKNSDGTITLNGTTTSATTFTIGYKVNDNDGIVQTGDLNIKNISGTMSTKIISGSIDHSKSSTRLLEFNLYDTDGNNAIQSVTNKQIGRIVQTTGTLDESVTYNWADITISNSVTCNNLVLGLQVEQGEETEYEQYGASPSPDYPSEIKTIPSIRNLFDKDGNIGENKNLDEDGNISDNTGLFVSYDYISVKPNTQYTISTTDGNYKRIGQYDENKTFISRLLSSATSTQYTFTTDSDCYYIRIACSITDLDSIMLEEGSIVHDYVPYGAWAKVKVTGKNLLNPTHFTSRGSSLYTKNDDDSINVIASDTSTWTSHNENQKIKLKAGTYTVSVSNLNGGKLQVYNYDTSTSINSVTTNYCTFTLSSTTNIGFKVHSATSYPFTFKAQLEKDTEPTEYEPYKEKEVLIDLSKPNLWDRDKWSVYTGNLVKYGDNGFKLYKSTNRVVGFTLPEYLPTGQYTFKYNAEYSNLTDASKLGLTVKTSGNTTLATLVDNSQHEIVFNTTGEFNQLYFYINADQADDATISLNNIGLYNGFGDYYELTSINEVKDKLNIIDGQVVINKKICKVVLNGSESWQTPLTTNNSNYRYRTDIISNLVKSNDNSTIIPDLYCSHYNIKSPDGTYLEEEGITISGTNIVIYDSSYNTNDMTAFKTWLSENPVTVYYELAESQQISLPNVNIPLFEGINHISLVDDLETTTSIKYYRNTPISQDYVIQQQLDETNSNLSTTTDKTNQNASDINATNTNLNNNYYNKDQIDVMNTSTQEIVTQIKNQVETTTTATNLQISILQEQLTNGVTSVVTETGYRFDKDGLSISKTGEPMRSLLDNNGLTVYRDETIMLKADSNEVITNNLTVKTYLVIGTNTRVEDYKGGTGFFNIGGAN